MTKAYLIPRRSFLRGAGAAVALPLLDIMSPALARASAGQSSPPLRLCVLYKGCGVNPSSWDVSGRGEQDFDLSRILSPLKPHQRDILVLSGINSDLRANGTHVHATLAFMTGKVKQSEFRQSMSFDQLVADRVGQATPVKSLVLRGDPYIDGNDASENFLSYDREGSPLPVEADPKVVFRRLFRGFHDPRTRARTASILDDVLESYRAIERKASTADRRTLEQYLTAVRGVESEIEQFASEENRQRQQRLPTIEEPSFEHMGERITALLDLVALAFWTDMTRVASLIMAHTESRGSYPFIGIKEEFHYLSHFVRNERVIPDFDRVNQWHVARFAYFLDKLKSYSDAEGSLLDQSVVLFGSGIKHGDYHSVSDLPIVLAGGRAAQLKLGRHVRYRHAPNGNLLLKLANVMGVDATEFGNSTEPLPGITETGTFHTAPVNDGSWKIESLRDGEIIVKGRLQVIIDKDDPNRYLLTLSDGSHIDIRCSFKNINSSQLDVHVGSVIVLTGRSVTTDGRSVVTEVLRFKAE